MDTPTEFELDTWEKDARRKIVCTGCYGVGQKHDRKTDRWFLCPVCKGDGYAEADPNMIRLIEYVRKLKASSA